MLLPHTVTGFVNARSIRMAVSTRFTDGVHMLSSSFLHVIPSHHITQFASPFPSPNNAHTNFQRIKSSWLALLNNSPRWDKW